MIKEFLRYYMYKKITSIRFKLFLFGLPVLTENMRFNISLELCFQGHLIWDNVSDKILRKTLKTFIKNGGNINEFIYY